MLQLGLVCFRLKGSDELNQKLLSNINASGKIHMVPASVNEKYVIRFCAVVQNATEEQIGASTEMHSLTSHRTENNAMTFCVFLLAWHLAMRYEINFKGKQTGC